MRRALRIALVMSAAGVAGGCSHMDGDNSHKSLIPSHSLNISPSLSIPAEGIAAIGIVYLIIDPLAPNWKVEVAPVGQRRFSIRMTMKRFITGGEGEIGPVLRRAAEKLRDEGGYAEYALIELTEGIESRVPIAQRVAHGVIELR
jgi:hypothetical protein